MVPLTERQQEVLRLAGDGLTYQEIAAELGIKPETAKNHAAAVKRKLGVRSKRGLVPASRAYFAEQKESTNGS